MKNIAILGSTGSIGKNALKVIDELGKEYKVLALSANNNVELLLKQIEKYKPNIVSIGTEEGYKRIRDKFPGIIVFQGELGLKEIGKLKEIDILLTAVSGAIGIEATIEAIKNGKRIALANKETMVSAGPLIKKLVKENNAEIIPVDSEHSAIYQALKSGKKTEVSKLILTASGGPFRNFTKEQIEKVNVEDALKHPNWSMGRKITVDSASLINKGLEVIEAHYLFDIAYEKIEVIVHPESIIHSMVEFSDRSTIAQMGHPDMKLPIQYAFTYPDRKFNANIESLDFTKCSQLNFEKVRKDTFRGLELAYEAGKAGDSMPIVFNAANEIAVERFLNKEIKFFDIYRIIEECMLRHHVEKVSSLNTVKLIDKETRIRARRVIG